MTEVDVLVLEFIQLSIDLANSVQSDVLHGRRVVSDHSVICQSRVRRKHDELDEALEAAEGLN